MTRPPGQATTWLETRPVALFADSGDSPGRSIRILNHSIR